MANLPPELIDRVCHFLPLGDLKNTLFVSRAWQYASERVSGAFAEFFLTESNAETFLSLYGGRRWGYLRHVTFRTHLPRYDEGSDDEDSDDNEEDEEIGDERENEKINEDAKEEGDEEREIPEKETHRCRESREEVDEKDRLFTDQINYVFSTLRTLEERVFSGGNIQLTIYTPIREVHSTCPHRRCTSWRLHLLDPSTLPELNSICGLSVEDESIVYPLEENACLPKLDLRILIDLVVKLPHLEYLRTKLTAGSGLTTDWESEEAIHHLRDFTSPHRDSRHNFAQTLENAQLPSTLRQAQLDFMYPLSFAERINQLAPVPNLAYPAKEDPFSSSLRLITQQLRKLELRVVADASLFWPSSGEASFPHLESLNICFHMSTPSGKWYFYGPNGEGLDTPAYPFKHPDYPPYADTEEDESMDDSTLDGGVLEPDTKTTLKFRVKPDDNELVPFLTAFAKAAANMPNLREALLWTPLLWDASDIPSLEDYDAEQLAKWPERPLAWGIAYVAPGTLPFHVFPGQRMNNARQLWWMTGGWRPSADLRGLFQRIGGEETELVEYWAHDKYGEKLALRNEFEQFAIFGSRNVEDVWPVRVGEKWD